MDMISNHLEQVALSATAIAELPFPKPKIFVNALLQSHDITALIRDTEIHERALFKAAAESDGVRKSMAPGASAGEAALGSLKPGTAVGRILGSDLQRRIRRSERNKGEVDVDLLLEGAEKLVAAYPMPGVAERIQAMRTRHEKLASSIALYEKKLADQAAEFEQLSAQSKGNAELDDDFTTPAPLVSTLSSGKGLAASSIEDEEAELEQLEQKRKGLEDRVNGLERDLGGLRG